MKILKRIFLTVWTLWCLLGIISTFSYWEIGDWIFIIPFVSTPYLIIWFVSYKVKKRKASKQDIVENNYKTNIPTNNMKIPPNNLEAKIIVPHKEEDGGKIKNSMPQTASSQYIETNNVIYRADEKPISDEEVPYLIQMGYENALAEERQSANPKFHRSMREEDLSFNFEMKYAHEVDSLTEAFETLYRNAYETDDLSKRVSLLKDAVKAFEKAKRFCYAKGKGGTIYFQDMWEYMHNSRNQCYSYLDNIKQSLDEAVFEKDIAIPSILDTISENDGILQKDIYAFLPDINRSIIQRIIRKLESDNRISRTKKRNSYELHLLR